MLINLLVVLASFSGGHNSTNDRPLCGEYRPGRVLAGEFQHLRRDVSPPQVLDIVMYRGRLAGETPVERCDDMGGTLGTITPRVVRLPICRGVDY